MPADRGKLALVQGLRALAALAIAMHHIEAEAALIAEQQGGAFQRSELPWSAGVDVFFVISGFIMVYASRELFGSPGAGRTFLVRRITRIAPLYWLVTSLVLLIGLIAPHALNSGRPGPTEILASYLFLPYERADGLVQPVYSLGWTLNYEMLFYVLFAAAIGLSRERAVAAVSAGLIALVAAGMIWRLPEPLYFWSVPIVLEFVFGMGIALALAHGFRLSVAARIALALAGLALLYLDFDRAGSLVPLPTVIAHGVPAALLVMAAAAEGDGAKAMSSGRRALVALGDASYALYLIHPFVMRAMSVAYTRLDGAAAIGVAGYMLLALAASVIASLVVYRLIERPLTSALRSSLSQPQASS